MSRRVAAPFLLCCALVATSGADMRDPTLSTANQGTRFQVLEVGNGLRLERPSDAARESRDGALVLIHAGSYLDDVAVWRQNRLRILGVGGTARLITRGATAEDKAIWVIKGSDVEVEHVEFSGARSTSRNGAGIRFEGRNLTLRHCRFHDNQMGLLTSPNKASRVRIENSEFHHNTVDYRRHGRLGHNIYIGRNASFVLRESHVHSARTGHLVKSRAHSNLILYNRLSDETSASSYLIDLAEGGQALIMGNLLHKDKGAENQSAISFAAEANRDAQDQGLYVVYNTLVTERPASVLVRNHSRTSALVANNLVQGDARALLGEGLSLSNLILAEAGLAEASGYDFRLRPRSPAIDAARPGIRTREQKPLLPTRQYRHPRGSEPRPNSGPPDIGAYELIIGDRP